MSRGLGEIERRALACLEASGMMRIAEVAGSSEDRQTIDEATYRSYARALRSLVRKGLAVDLGRSWRRGSRMYATPEKAAEYHQRTSQVFGIADAPARPLTASPSRRMSE